MGYAEESASLLVHRIDEAPVLDGVLNDAAWKQAARVTDFMQFQPKEGVSMTEETVAYIGYDSRNLYIAFYAKDSEPQKMRAHLAPRDQAFGDDWVGILLDTFGDQRRAYEFISNPLGVQIDIFSAAGKEDVAPDFAKNPIIAKNQVLSMMDQDYDLAWPEHARKLITIQKELRGIPPIGGAAAQAAKAIGGLV